MILIYYRIWVLPVIIFTQTIQSFALSEFILNKIESPLIIVLEVWYEIEWLLTVVFMLRLAADWL